MMQAPGRTHEFRERGFVLVKRLLGPEMVERLVQQLEQLSGITRASFGGSRIGDRLLRRGLYKGWTMPDGVSRTRSFWDLVFLPELLDVVRDVLSAEPRFLQHTDLQVGFSAVTWHRDSVTRRLGWTGDWDETREPYRLVRVGFYLQSHAESRFALGLVPGSHRHGALLEEAGLARLERQTAPWRQAVALASGRSPVARAAEWVPAERGDAIVFDPRIVHSGSPIRGPKYSAFVGFGIPNLHFARHLHYYRHTRRELGYRALDAELVQRLEQAGLWADAPSIPPFEDNDTGYRPGRIQRFLGRAVRPRLAGGASAHRAA